MEPHTTEVMIRWFFAHVPTDEDQLKEHKVDWSLGGTKTNNTFRTPQKKGLTFCLNKF